MSGQTMSALLPIGKLYSLTNPCKSAVRRGVENMLCEIFKVRVFGDGNDMHPKSVIIKTCSD
jgi:hypothetical protein